MDYTEKKVLVYGSGKSGIGAAALLLKLGACPVIYDSSEQIDTKRVRLAVEEKSKMSAEALSFVLGDAAQLSLMEPELVVLSPGIPTDLPAVLELKEKKIPVIGEVELAYRVGRGKVYAITGTNGKTTSTTLLGEIMKAAFPEVYVVGNIGNPYTDIALEQTDAAVTVAEISSFQLETMQEFHASAAAITNITPDHLNRHHTMEEYIRVKKQIILNQDASDLCVLNYEDEVLREFGKQVPSQVLYFSSVRELDEGMYLKDGWIVSKKDGQITKLLELSKLQMPGAHNHENVMTAAAIALFAGVDIETVQKTVYAFPGVEHRIEFAGEFGGVKYYNDSKGTNPDAAIKAIRAMDRPTLLIGGGYDKQASYEEWIQSFDGKVKYLVLIGQTKEKIAAAAKACGFAPERTILCEDLQEAAAFCREHSCAGDAVLLSPACASWGQFDNYEQRGEVFKELIRQG